MRTELIIEGNAVYEIDFECMEKKNLAGGEAHRARAAKPENAEKERMQAGMGQPTGQNKAGQYPRI